MLNKESHKKIDDLLEEIKKSFIFVSETENGNRSSIKVDSLHNVVANHLQSLLGEEYIVRTKLKTGKEETLGGRYYNKKTDIVVERAKDGKHLAGIGLKSILSSYGKNKNNYFENMLGETANIRSNNIPYFQIIILPYKTPDFTKSSIRRFTFLSSANLFPYQKLSEDNTLSFFHTPNKTLLLIVKYLPDYTALGTKEDYFNFYINNNNENNLKVEIQVFDKIKFDGSLILNDYDLFLQKIAYLIKGFS